MTKTSVPEGTKLVFARTAFYQGVRAGSIGEVPTEVADLAVKAGWAVEVDSLDARIRATSKRVATASEVYESGTTGPQDLADALQKEDGTAVKYGEATREDENGVHHLVDASAGPTAPQTTKAEEKAPTKKS